MTTERMRILNLVAEGKVSPADAGSLLDALGEAPEPGAPPAAATGAGATALPRYLRVVVDDPSGEQGGRVNVRVPLTLIRAGVRLAALLPPGVTDQVNKALGENGFPVDVSKLRAEDLEELVSHLGELTVDVEGSKGEKVKVFCE
jgi:hypothetical protein